MPDKQDKKPDYKLSLSILMAINAVEEGRCISREKLFELFDNCMKDIVAKLETPHLNNIEYPSANSVSNPRGPRF